MRVFAAAVVLVALVVGACGAQVTPTPGGTATATAAPTATPTPTPTPKPPQTLVYGFAGAIEGGCDGAQTHTIALQLNCTTLNQETLVTFDWATNTVKPALAESWEEDGDSVTFTLRPGVTFQDGTPFDADAVVFNFRRVWDESFSDKVTSIYAANVAFKSVEKIDDMKVRVIFQQAAPNLLWGLASFPAYIQSPTAVKAEGKDYTFKPVGTGPYKVVSYTEGSRIELERYPDYWGTAPQPDRVVIVMGTSSQALVNDLLSGTIDVMQNPPVEQLDQIRSANYQIDSFPSLVLFYENINVTLPPFDDVRVRQAANYALDKEAITQVAKGTGRAMYGAWFEGGYAYWAPDAPYRFDLAKAGQLLDDAGWILPAGGKVREKDGQPLKITAATYSGAGGLEQALTTVMISNLQDVGFEVSFQTIEGASYSPDTLKPFNIVHFGFGVSFPDPQTWLQRNTTSAIPPAELNLSYYSNPEYDQLIAAAAKELDPGRREQLLQDAQRILYEDAPVLFATQLTSTVAYSPAKFSAVPVLPNSRVDIWGISFK